MTTAGAYLGAYLNDHFASAAAALTLLDGLRASDDDDLRNFALTLSQAIAQDREQLGRLMITAGVQPDSGISSIANQPRQWKRAGGAALEGGLKTFELLELLALELDAKRALWPVLRIVSTDVPSLRTDFSLMAQRADDQRTAVEARRLEWAAKAFSEGTH
jgi:hypothetical protein